MLFEHCIHIMNFITIRLFRLQKSIMVSPLYISTSQSKITQLKQTKGNKTTQNMT